MSISNIFLYFIIYSFIGWIYESIYCSITEKKLVNRGFLTGPFIPIYGLGAVLIILLFYDRDYPWIIIFAFSMVLTSSLEYATSFLLEKIFKARWWDYSNDPFNLNGRIYLLGTLIFSSMAVVTNNVIHPLIEKLVDNIPVSIKLYGSLFLLAYFVIDFTATIAQLIGLAHRLSEAADAFNKFRLDTEKMLNELKTDLVEKIEESDFYTDRVKLLMDKFEESEFNTDRIKNLMSKGHFQAKRIAKAFPSFKYINNNVFWEKRKAKALSKDALKQRKHK